MHITTLLCKMHMLKNYLWREGGGGGAEAGTWRVSEVPVVISKKLSTLVTRKIFTFAKLFRPEFHKNVHS